ncbi:MAG: TadE family protein [Acidimicrobiales bacterium]
MSRSRNSVHRRGCRGLGAPEPHPAGRSSPGCRDSGSLTVELVVMTPVLVLFVTAALVFGRITSSRQQVIEAARAGAETAATVAAAGDAAWSAQVDAAVTDAGSGRICRNQRVSSNLSHFFAGGYVTVTVACQVRLSDLALPGMPGSTTVSASATAPVDPYRSIG